jgi:hypothetical protein
VEEAVLATFEQITLHPTKRNESGTDLAARVGSQRRRSTRTGSAWRGSMTITMTG